MIPSTQILIRLIAEVNPDVVLNLYSQLRSSHWIGWLETAGISIEVKKIHEDGVVKAALVATFLHFELSDQQISFFTNEFFIQVLTVQPTNNRMEVIEYWGVRNEHNQTPMDQVVLDLNSGMENAAEGEDRDAINLYESGEPGNEFNWLDFRRNYTGTSWPAVSLYIRNLLLLTRDTLQYRGKS